MSFGQAYYENYGGQSVSAYVERHILGSPTEMDRMRRTVEVIPADVGSVLDVGAGHGIFLEKLKAERGIDGIGIEITQAKVDYGRSRGVDMRIGDASKLAFDDRSFDALVSCEVLEHLPYGTYEAALSEFARVAREWIIVTVPYDEHRHFVRCPYCRATVNPDYHFRSFAPGSMQGLMAGFRLERSLALGRRRSSLLLTAGRRLRAAWPCMLVCPCCGYLESDRAVRSAEEPLKPSLLRRVAEQLPARYQPNWLLGLFRREHNR